MRVSFEYYINEYGGTLINEDEFKRYEKRASLRLDEIVLPVRTEKALANDKLGDKIKYVLCEIMDVDKEHQDLKEVAKTSDLVAIKGVQSETVKDHSISYKTSDESASEQLVGMYKRQTYELIRGRLLTTGLLYRGL